MQRWRTAVGMAAGALLVLSSAAHSLLGWSALKQELAKIQAPPDLMFGLAAGWHFGGVAMLGFGCIVIAQFVAARRNAASSLLPAKLIAVAYLFFGSGALIASKFDPFFLAFLIPALLLCVALFNANARQSTARTS